MSRRLTILSCSAIAWTQSSSDILCNWTWTPRSFSTKGCAMSHLDCESSKCSSHVFHLVKSTESSWMKRLWLQVQRKIKLLDDRHLIPCLLEHSDPFYSFLKCWLRFVPWALVLISADDKETSEDWSLPISALQTTGTGPGNGCPIQAGGEFPLHTKCSCRASSVLINYTCLLVFVVKSWLTVH